MAEDAHSVANERLLRRPEAARYLSETWRISHSVATLAKLAVAGSGPEFRKAGGRRCIRKMAWTLTPNPK
jgi:hypothetical protein